jgi:hypothetical protein
MSLVKCLRNIYYWFVSERWNIGIVLTSPQEILNKKHLNIQWLKHPYKDRWFADPFVLKVTEKEIVLLVEEFLLKTKKGRITKLTINKKNLKITAIKNILELETHLSFPNIIAYKDSIYVLPENTGSNKAVLYRYYPENDTIESTSVLYHKPLADPVIVPVCSRYYLLATPFPDYSGKALSIYEAKSFFGPYVFKRIIQFTDNVARNAGSVFKIDGEWIRPAQICNISYGEGVVLQKIVFKKSSEANIDITSEGGFNELCRFYPMDRKYKLGLHTFNTHKNIVVVDGKYYACPIVRKIILLLIGIIRKYQFLETSHSPVS